MTIKVQMDTGQQAELLYRRIALAVPVEVHPLIEHKRIAEPLRKACDSAVLGSKDMARRISFIADFADTEAIVAAATMESLPSGSAKRAMSAIMHAWVHVHEACVFGIHDET